jgi:hypothetical protein
MKNRIIHAFASLSLVSALLLSAPVALAGGTWASGPIQCASDLLEVTVAGTNPHVTGANEWVYHLAGVWEWDGAQWNWRGWAPYWQVTAGDAAPTQYFYNYGTGTWGLAYGIDIVDFIAGANWYITINYVYWSGDGADAYFFSDNYANC